MEVVLSTVTFAPGSIELLVAAKPPTIKQLKRLPTHHRGLWGVYILILERYRRRSKAYVGRGTDKIYGVTPRVLTYHRASSKSQLPKLVWKAVHRGYRITHVGLLCWVPIPSARNQFLVRSLFLILETVFAFTLWAMVSRTKSYGMPKLLP
jgi:hypothetical protein